jgi:hypothetical protein
VNAAAQQAVQIMSREEQRNGFVADLEAERAKRAADPAQPRTSWAPIDLTALIEGGDLEQPAELLTRTDGQSLLYRGKLHSTSGEPEAGKGWLATAGSAECLAAGEVVIYIDFEDSPQTLVQRLLALGVQADHITAGLLYIRPDEPFTDISSAELQQAIARQPALAILDGVTEALALQGLDLGDNTDVAKWLELLPRPLSRSGAAVVLIDHVVKSREDRGRYAIGAQHKLAGVDVAYTLEVIEPFGRGRQGLSKIKVQKDRPGHVRQHAHEGRVADMHLTSGEDGTVTIELRPPETGPTFRPTWLMEQISIAIEQSPGLTKSDIRRDLKGKNDAKDAALRILIEEGHVNVQIDGQARRHHSLQNYRQDTDPAPLPQPCPNPAPAGSSTTVPHAPHPVGGQGKGTQHQGTTEPTMPEGQGSTAEQEELT